MTSIVSLKEVSKTYGSGHHALKGVSLDIEEGEILALLGPNGAGKTTLISIICGIVSASGGTVTVGGHDTEASFRESRRVIGRVPQEIALGPFETVWNTVSFSRGLFGKAPDAAYLEKTLRQLSLWDKKDAQVKELSGGMKRRLLVAKALVHRPPVVVLDEPTAGVDIELRRGLWDYMRALKAQGVTIILTTHYLEEAQELCDTIAIVNHGEIIACEPTPTLLKRLDHKTLAVTPRETLRNVPTSLADLDAGLRDDGTLAITYRATETGIGRLLERVREAGISIADLATEEPDLEDVFVSMTTSAE